MGNIKITFDEDMDVSDTTETITNKYIFQNYCVYRIWFGYVHEQVQERGQPGYHAIHGDHQREVQPCMWVGPKPCKPRIHTSNTHLPGPIQRESKEAAQHQYVYTSEAFPAGRPPIN